MRTYHTTPDRGSRRGRPQRVRALAHREELRRVATPGDALRPFCCGGFVGNGRSFLRRRYEELTSAISTFHITARPLHGEPHAANLLMSIHGPRWVDFESACLGPQEWDLTALPDKIVFRYFTDVDADLLRLLRLMRSLCVAVWCWLDPGRAPALRRAGEYHLQARYESSL